MCCITSHNDLNSRRLCNQKKKRRTKMKDKEPLDLVRLAMTERNVSQRDMARE